MWMLAAGVALCLAFFGLGARLLWLQEARLMRYTPVDVTIDGARIEEITDSEGEPIYRPVIAYHYEIGGHRFRGERVTPLNSSGGRVWAEQRVADYRVGRTYTGWHDPANPNEAFLVRERMPIPYLFMLIATFGSIVCGLGIAGLRKLPG
jgi:hypothetical protein